MSSRPPIEYDVWKRPGQPEGCFRAFDDRVREVAGVGGATVGDLGGGANPLLDLPFIGAHGLDYSVFDASAEELEKTPDGYRTVLTDLCAEAPVQGGLDLAFSKTVCEHLSEPAGFHRNVYEMLRPGGIALHFFPTLYAPPFVVNRVLSEDAGAVLLSLLQGPRRDPGGSHGKFPALYRWCRGPTEMQLHRFRGIGFEISSYRAYFGHDYYRRLPLLARLSELVARALVRRPVPLFTSYAIVELRKPLEGSAPASEQRP